MESKSIRVGDDVRHKIKILNRSVPMKVSDIQNDQALCEHFEPDEEGGATHHKTWYPIVELEKVIYGNS